MNEVIEHDGGKQQVAVAPATDATAFVAMLERASRDPTVDVDKLERLMSLHERMIDRQAAVEFNQAFAKMQAELPEMPELGAIKNRAGEVQSRYALWEDVNEILKPLLTKHGFALSFRIGNEGANVVVTGVLRHVGGHSDSSTFSLPLDDSGAKNKVQGAGSAASYGKRYVAGALLNLTSRHEDDDGRGGKITNMTDDQRADWLAAIEAVTKDEADDLWQKISEACTKIGDVASFNDLKGAMAKRVRALAEAK